MQGRSLEEIDELFQNEVPTREFAKYHCVSVERAREQALKNTGILDADTAPEGDDKKAKIEQKEVSA